MSQRQFNFDDGNRPSAEEARTRCREKYDAELLVNSTANSKKFFHIPDGDTEEPLCTAVLLKNDWRRASLSIYPPGYYQWCTDCLAREFPDRANITVRDDK
jgi:hypothetical protein